MSEQKGNDFWYGSNPASAETLQRLALLTDEISLQSDADARLTADEVGQLRYELWPAADRMISYVPLQTFREVIEPVSCWLTRMHVMMTPADVSLRLAVDRKFCDLRYVEGIDSVVANMELLELSVQNDPEDMLPIIRTFAKSFDIPPEGEDRAPSQQTYIAYERSRDNEELLGFVVTSKVLRLQQAEADEWISHLENYRSNL